MLARENRLISADDFRTVMRTGKKQVSTHLVTYLKTDSGTSVQFGFVVAKTVGNAVTRNLVKRRLRALARTQLPQISPGSKIVVRALDQAGTATFEQLEQELSQAVKTVRDEKAR